MSEDNLEEMSYEDFCYNPYDLNYIGKLNKQEYFFEEEEFSPYDLNQVRVLRKGNE